MLRVVAMSAVAGGQVLPIETYSQDNVAISIVGATATLIDAPLVQTADATLGYARQAGKVNIQTLGSSSAVLDGSGDVVGSVINGSAVRLARVADPDDSGLWCWWMRCAKTDADTSGANSKRMEFRYPDGILYDDVVTFGFKYRIGDYVGHTDKFLLSQIHAGATGSISNPWWALEIVNNQSKIVVRYNDADVSTVTFSHAINTWVTAVVVTKNHAINGYTQVWIDGVLLMNYQGPIGEETPRYDSYLKFGPYEWDAAVQWDDTYPVREIYGKGAYLANGDRRSEMIDLLASA